MKKAVKIFFAISLLCCTYIFTSIYIMSGEVADSYKVVKGDELQIDSFAPVSVVYNGSKMSQSSFSRKVGDTFEVDLKIFGVIPFSTAEVEVVDEMYVSVLGNPFGMKIYTNGVLVIESTNVSTPDGNANPALAAGIKVGDYIKSVNGKKITCNEDLSQLVSESDGSAMIFDVVRNGTDFSCAVRPAIDQNDGVYRIGIWVRDSSAGIGTLTFYSPTTNTICGLGHGVCDADTETILQIESGEMVEAEVISVDKGTAGSPGALKGKLSYKTIADIRYNCEKGVYGISSKKINAPNLTKVALKQEVKEGDAQILCTVNGNTPKLYDCKIKKNTSKKSATQNLTVTVTDPELINATGGIVQGMSGSPIIQNGKLVGALTHVLVDDPTRGYAIYAENMLETARNAEQLKAAW